MSRILEMRNAIDAMEMAMMGWPELIDLPETWGEPRHREDLRVPAGILINPKRRG
jgi:hypothetical protein